MEKRVLLLQPIFDFGVSFSLGSIHSSHDYESEVWVDVMLIEISNSSVDSAQRPDHYAFSCKMGYSLLLWFLHYYA